MRERIVAAAAELIAERGVAQTSLDDVIERAGASKSQLYHYFEDRAALLRAVVVHNAGGVLGDLPPLDGWRAIRSWFDTLAAIQGGLVLTQSRRDPGQLATALDAAYANLRAHAASPRTAA